MPVIKLGAWTIIFILRNLAAVVLLSICACSLAFAQTVDSGVIMEAGSGIAELEAHSVGPEDYGQGLINFVTYGTYNPDSTNTMSVAGAVSRVINFFALVIMAALAVVGGLSFTIHTANKGTPGGQVISSFWMPIRVSISTILLVPLTLGFSTIQMGVTKIAETGNAHGSWLSSQVVDHLRGHGAYVPPDIRDNIIAMQGLVISESCKLYINSQLNADAVNSVAVRYDESVAISYDYQDPRTGIFGKKAPIPAYCGAVSINIPGADGESDIGTLAPNLVADKFFTAFKAGGDFQVRAQAIAQSLMADQAALRQMQSGNSGAQATFEGEVAGINSQIQRAATDLAQLTQAYNSFVQKEVANAVNKQREAVVGGDTTWSEEIKERGWTALGTIFWQTSKTQQEINTLASMLTPNYSDIEIDEKYIRDERFSDLKKRLDEMVRLYEPAPQLQNSEYGNIVFLEKSGINDEQTVAAQKWFAVLTQGISKALILDDKADFVNQMQASGNTIVATIDNAFHARVWAEAFAKRTSFTAQNFADAASEAASGIPFVGGAIKAAAKAATTLVVGAARFTSDLVAGYAKLLDAIMVPLMFAGFMLAVVLPSIPLFLWLVGVVSWIIYYIECLLVSPLWMSAHGTAEKEGWGSEHTRQGYMLMIGLYLNPILRVAGFAMILTLLYPLGVLIGWLSKYLVGVLATGVVTSPLMLTGGALILAFFAYSIAIRAFSVPNELFEHGLRWVNGGQSVTGDENASNRINMMVANFGSRSQFGMVGRLTPSPTPTTSPDRGKQ